ncbi:MAG: Type secretion system protein [Burkholderiales bacterium]|jgi:hypothetical protein|nr:Type secretion system protein [Burkholderiales bacterium]
MLTTKRINIGISIISRILRVVIILYSASLLANCIWWLLSPSDADIFVQQPSLDTRDRATTYINNNSPFGIIVVKAKVTEKPRIIDQLKLTGVYLNTNKDSFAFLEYQGKPTIARQGAQVAGSEATIKSISPSSIVVNSDGEDVTIKITAGSAAQTANNNQTGQRNNPGTLFGGRGSFNDINSPQHNTGSGQQSSQQQSIEDFKQRRQKMMDEYNAANSRGTPSRSGNVGNLRERSSVSDD